MSNLLANQCHGLKVISKVFKYSSPSSAYSFKEALYSLENRSREREKKEGSGCWPWDPTRAHMYTHTHTHKYTHPSTRIVGTQLAHPAQPSWPPEKVWLWDWWSSWPGSCCTLWSPPAATPWSQTPAPCCWTRARRWWGSSSSLRRAPSGWESAGGWGWPGSCSSSSADTAWSVGWNERGSCTRCSWGRRGSTTGSRKPRSGTTRRRAEWWSHPCGTASAVDLENTGGQISVIRLHFALNCMGGQKFQQSDLTPFPFNYSGGKLSLIWFDSLFLAIFSLSTIYIKLFPCQSISNIAATPFLY